MKSRLGKLPLGGNVCMNCWKKICCSGGPLVVSVIAAGRRLNLLYRKLSTPGIFSVFASFNHLIYISIAPHPENQVLIHLLIPAFGKERS